MITAMKKYFEREYLVGYLILLIDLLVVYLNCL